jgi:hypothetical protein
MNCAEIRSILPDYLDEELEEILVMEVEEHLAACAVCRENVRQLRATIEAVRSSPKQRAPAGLAEAVARQIRTETGPVAPPVTTPQLARGFQPIRMVRTLAAAAVLALALGLGAHVYNVLFEEEEKVDELTTTAPTDDLAEKRKETDTTPERPEREDMIERVKKGAGRDVLSERHTQEKNAFGFRARAKGAPAGREEAGQEMPALAEPSPAPRPSPEESKRAKAPGKVADTEMEALDAAANAAKDAGPAAALEPPKAPQPSPPFVQGQEAQVDQARPTEPPRNEIWIQCADPATEVKLAFKMLATEVADEFPSVEPARTRTAKAKAPEDEGLILTGRTTPKKWNAFLVRLKKDKSLQWRQARLAEPEERQGLEAPAQKKPPSQAPRLIRFRLHFLPRKQTPTNNGEPKP